MSIWVLFPIFILFPEEDESYIEYWEQYPDPIQNDNKDGTPNPKWLDNFRLKMNASDGFMDNNEDNKIEEITNDNESYENDNDDKDYFPVILEYNSPPRNTFTRLEAEENLDLGKLPKILKN